MRIEKERRTNAVDIEIRKGKSEGTRIMAGHAAVFNKRSVNLGWFIEIMEPGCFAASLADPDLRVYSLFNHEESRVLGSTKNGSVRLSEDKTGLYSETDLLGDTTESKDMIVRLDTNLIEKMSFAFTIAPDGATWDEDESGLLIRTVTRVQRLYDVSPVTYPAYPDTDLGIRGLPGMTGHSIGEIMSLLTRAENGLKMSPTQLESLKDLSKRLNNIVSGVAEEPEIPAPVGLTVDDLKRRFYKLL